MSNTVQVHDVAKAIADITECRRIHALYVDYFKGNPEEAAKPDDRPYAEVVGDISHHQGWCERYDNVLAILGSLQSGES